MLAEELGLVGRHVDVHRAVALAALAGQAEVQRLLDVLVPPAALQRVALEHLEKEPRPPTGRVRLLAQEATPVRVQMKGDSVELVAITQDVGQAHEELDATYAGQELMVAFNPQYLLDGVEVTPGEQVTLETVDALKPALIRSVDTADFVYLLMPVRVS